MKKITTPPRLRQSAYSQSTKAQTLATTKGNALTLKSTISFTSGELPPIKYENMPKIPLDKPSNEASNKYVCVFVVGKNSIKTGGKQLQENSNIILPRKMKIWRTPSFGRMYEPKFTMYFIRLHL